MPCVGACVRVVVGVTVDSASDAVVRVVVGFIEDDTVAAGDAVVGCKLLVRLGDSVVGVEALIVSKNRKEILQ